MARMGRIGMHGYLGAGSAELHIVAPPRSGTRLLADLLGRSPDLAHHPHMTVDASDANALRVAALAARSLAARFVYLYRDPRETLSSMLDAWRSGQHITEPRLPGWSGPPWSLTLVPGWEALEGCTVAEVVARQWAIITTRLLDDLLALPPDHWCVASYDRLLCAPGDEAGRVARFVGLRWDDAATVPSTSIESPEPQAWRHNSADLEQVWPLVDDVAARARELLARPPATRPTRPPTTTDGAMVEDTEPDDRSGGFSSVHTPSLPTLLEHLGITVLVSTYQSGRLIAIRGDGDEVNTHFRTYASPMGIAVDQNRLALGTRNAVLEHRNQPAVAAKLHPVGRHDAAYLPRTNRITGEIQVHEVAYLADELWVVATRFSCLATLDEHHSFVPRWRPPFVSKLAAEDRCHLNGMAIVDGSVGYVTAMGQTDSAGGWRDHKVDGGVVLDVPSGEVVARGLSMPHSPRLHDGRLWVLSSGRGEVCTVDLATGAREVVVKLPGFTRGLAFAGPYAFVGLSQVRESVFGGIPLADELPAEERRCGVWVVDTRDGTVVGFLRFEGVVQELFDVQVLHGIRWPEIADVDAELTGSSFVVPDEAMADVDVARA